MNKTEAVAVILRFLAILFAFTFLARLPGSLTALNEQAGQINTYIALVYMLVFLIIACVLWFFPLTIASVILPTDDNNLSKLNIDNNSFLEIGIILIGVYYLFYAASDAFYWLFLVLVANHLAQDQANFPLSADQWAGIVVTIFEFFFALYLVFKTKGIANLILRLRKA